MRYLTCFLLLCSVAFGDYVTDIKADPNWDGLTDEQWNTKIKYRGADHMYIDAMDQAILCYERKLPFLKSHLSETKDKEELEYLNAKVSRILDKYSCLLKEKDFRKEDRFDRVLHHTVYYIDYDNGNDGNNGTGTGTAWKTLPKYTSETVRTAGDIAYLRANITWDCGTEAEDIVFDEDGTIDAYISIIGCDSVTNDPWGDASDVKPIIDFEDASYQILSNTDDYWYFERLDIRQSGDSYMVSMVSDHTYWKSCDFKDSPVASSGQIYWNDNDGVITLYSCTFEDSDSYAFLSYGSRSYVTDCTFTAGATNTTNYGILAGSSCSFLSLIDCTFSGAFDDADISILDGARVFARNTDWSGSGIDVLETGALYSEDDDVTFEAHKITYLEGTIERGTTDPRAGGADSFAIMTPAADCGLNRPLRLGDPMSGFARYWATASTQLDIDIYARVDSAWDSALTASECYAVFSYLSNAGTADRTEITSNDTIANDTTWTAIDSGNFTPLRTGWVYMWFYVAEYEDATEKVDVDIKPVINTP